MKGDFTRGIQPDRKRGKRYRRVLVQQSRVLLDSDAAALVDAFDHELRQVTSDLGCHLGSPDYGYLITPGRLLALFEHVDHVTTAGSAGAMRDYSRKYPEEPEGRYPSLRIDGIAAGNPGPAGTVTIPFVEPLAGPVGGDVALWYRADAAVSITVAAGTATTPLALPSATAWTRITAPIAVAAGATLRELAITGDAAAPIWIALVELDEDRQLGPHFWAAAGRFHAEGLTPQLASAAGYPELSYQAAVGFPASDGALTALPLDTRIVAYLETWERDITAAEDPGIREVALGRVDTTVRTEVIGQVKWAAAGTLTPAELRRAFEAVDAPQAELVVSAPTTPPSSDPCALPTSGGYTGADHRLYRFEVQVGGAALAARLKWSRDNACHVFPVRATSGNRVTLDRSCGLAAGDIVEILSDVVDLADTGHATIAAAGVTPATREVGLLARLRQDASDSQGRDVFSLIDLVTAGPVDPSTDPRYPTIAGELVPLRLRRWDGIATPAAVGPDVKATIEDGIEITLTGTFHPGEYWQYEARRGVANVNGAWRPRPHGPERILAPLAVLAVRQPADPVFLEAWLDDRFSALCELDADDIAFDGERVGSDADTVQEAIEELYERDAGNCCDATLGPNGPTGDDAIRIRAVLDAITFPDGGHLCLEPGVYTIATPIVIDRDVVIRGCPEATLHATGNDPIFHITDAGRLRIEQLILYNGPVGGGTRLVELEAGGRLHAREVGFLGVRAAAIRTPGANVLQPDVDAADDPLIAPDSLPPREDLASQIELRDCVVIAASGIVGSYVTDLAARNTAFVVNDDGIAAERIDQLVVEGCSFRGGLAPTFFAAWPAAHLRARADELLDAVTTLPFGDACGVAVHEVMSGVLARNQFRCEVGLWARVARDLSVRDDEHAGREEISWGIRIHHARRVDIEGARITARNAVAVPLSARQLTVRRCVIEAYASGIAIAGENHELVNAGAIVGVAIDGNHVATRRWGIAVGAAGTKAGEVDDVRIAGNLVRVDATHADGAAVIAVGDGQATTAVVVDANDLTTNRLGIQIAGTGGVVRGNQIRLSANGPAVSVLSVAALGQVAVVDNVITGGNNAFTGIRLDGTPDLRVTGNQVRTTASPHAYNVPAALSVTAATASQRHYVVGNDFATGGVTIHNAHNLHLVGNAIRLLTVDSGPSGQHGVIHGNQLGVILIFIIPISATLTGLRGIWKVSDNVAPGPIWINGATHQELLWSGAFSNAYAISKYRAATANVSGEERAKLFAFTGTTEPGEAMAASPRRNTLGNDTALSEGMRELVGADAAIADIQDLAERELVIPMEDFVFEAEVFLLYRTVVDPFDFHVSGNRVGWLLVDAADGATADATSSLHVVDNKVTFGCEVEMFTASGVRLDNVVAVNSADSFSSPIGSQSTPILIPNLRH